MKSDKSKTPSTPAKALPSQFLVLPGPKQCLVIIREHFLLALLAALLVTVPLGYHLLSQPPEYRASASLLVEPRTDRIVNMEQVVDTGDLRGMERQILSTHIEQLRSRDFLRRVASTFDEEQRRELIAPYLEEEHGNGAVGPNWVAGMIRGNLRVEQSQGTLVIRIDVEHRTPEFASLIANRIAEEYVGYLMDYSEEGNVSAIHFLRRQAAALGAEVETMERRLQQYRAEQNLVSLEENQNIIVDRLKQLNNAVTSARVERTEIDTLIDQIEEYREQDRDLLEIEAIAGFGSLPRLKQRREQLESEREAMSERYLSRHPDMIENQRNLETVQQQIDRNIEEAIGELRSRQANAHEREARLRRELAEAERDSLELDELRVEYRAMERELETTRNTHAQILRRLDEATITSQLENSNLRVFEEAVTPGSPVFPDVTRTGMLLVFLGGMVFVGLPMGLYLADTRLKGWSDVEAHLGRSVIGELPRAKRVRKVKAGTIVARELDDPATIESFRSLYNQIGMVSQSTGPRSIVLASTLPREGKTFVTCNLAATFAAHGRRTLVIDGDLRGPTVHQQFGLANEQGFMKFIQGDESCEGDPAKKEDLGLQEVFPNLFVIPAGGRSKKPTEMFDSAKAGGFFGWMKEYFDVILVDTPPLALFPDTLNLASHVEEVVYVCSFKRVSRQQAQSYADRVDQTPANVLGVVMNQMPTGRSGAIYYSGCGYRDRRAYGKYYAKTD